MCGGHRSAAQWCAPCTCGSVEMRTSCTCRSTGGLRSLHHLNHQRACRHQPVITAEVSNSITPPGLAESSSILEAVAGVAEAAATKHEDNKSALMSAGFGALTAAALSRDSVTSGEVVALSKALRRLTTADDDRPVVSRCALSTPADKDYNPMQDHTAAQSLLSGGASNFCWLGQDALVGS